jgi:prepilin-type processing-associated H-X9-DG protein
MKTPTPRCHPGFTLVELLVVIVIIITLAALSLMGFRKIREAGDRATTIAVLRQLQVANVGYASEHNGQYVPLSSMDENKNRINDWHQSSVFLAYLTGDNSALEKGKTTDQRIAYRHGGKAVVVYYDGSTGMVSPEDIRDIDKKGGASHPFWKANAP